MSYIFDDFNASATCEEEYSGDFFDELDRDYDELDTILALEETFTRQAKMGANRGDMDFQDLDMEAF